MEERNRKYSQDRHASRRKAEEIIAEGRVNGQSACVATIGMNGRSVLKTTIKVDGKHADKDARPKIYLMSNKPRNVSDLLSRSSRANRRKDYLKGVRYRVFLWGGLISISDRAFIAQQMTEIS